MELVPFICLLATSLAYKHSKPYHRNDVGSNDDYQRNNNFSEDEIDAIKKYKSSANSRHFNTMDDIFDARLFDNRRLFGWVTKLLRKNQRQETPAPKPKYEDLVNDKIYYLQLTKNLTDNLTKLTSVMDLFTKTIQDRPIVNGLRRVSRSVPEERSEEIKKEVKGLSQSVESNADNISLNASNKNDTNTTTITTSNTETADSVVVLSGRRAYNSNELKNKLLSSINDTLNVIQYKIKTVSNVKEIFADRLMYKVGYIAGSLTAIKGFIDELQMSVVKSDISLDDKYILDMYDTVNKINEGSGKLLDLLNVYVDSATSELIGN